MILDGEKRETYDTRFCLWMSSKMKEDLKIVSEDTNVPISEILRMLARGYIKKNRDAIDEIREENAIFEERKQEMMKKNARIPIPTTH